MNKARKQPASARHLVIGGSAARLSLAALPCAWRRTVPAPQTALGIHWRRLGPHAVFARRQIDADNFEDLEEAWVWDGASFNSASGRSTPTYIDGILYTVAGPRRTSWRSTRHGRDHLVLSRTAYLSPRILDAQGLRQGRRLRRSGWPRRHLHHFAGVFPDRAGCENRLPAGGFRQEGAG